MRWIKKDILSGQILGGTWVNMGSEISALITAKAGFDWLVFDMEHGFGDYRTLLFQIQAGSSSNSAAIIRIPANDPVYFKRFLDLGASGIMVPWINDAQQAKNAVCAMKYPPEGIRGLATCTPATEFGMNREVYMREANDNLVLIVQIESRQALGNADEIAAVDGVNVLFIGPSDLSLDLGQYGDFNNSHFRKGLENVLQACDKHGKKAGILLKNGDQIKEAIQQGFSFIGFGTDTGLIVEGMAKRVDLFAKARADSQGSARGYIV